MDDFLREALEIVKAQAKVRTMTEEEISSMVRSLASSLRSIANEQDENVGQNVEEEVKIDPKKAIKEKSITCLFCNKSFKVLTKRHLAQHGLTPDEYREKYGYNKGTALIAKNLARERRIKMKEMKLWEKRSNSSS